MDLLYNEKTTVGRLASHFSQYFPHLTARTRRLLLWLLIAMLALGCCPSIRFLFRHFLKDAAPASQNCYYRACKHPGIDFQQIVKTNVQMALGVVPKELRNEPVFLSVDDTTIAKFGKKFEDAAVLLDHSDHTGHPYVNGHCFVSLTICVPTILVTRGVSRIHYVSVPVGYEMWRKDGNKNKLELAADLVDAVMPELDGRQVVLSFDSWYAKAKLLERLRGYQNLSVVTNVRIDTAMYERRPAPTGKRGRPRKRGARVFMDDFDCRYRMGDYLVGCRRVLTNLFGDCLVYAYVTQSKKGTRRLFLSTVRPSDLRMSCAWQEGRGLRQAGPEDVAFYPLRPAVQAPQRGHRRRPRRRGGRDCCHTGRLGGGERGRTAYGQCRMDTPRRHCRPADEAGTALRHRAAGRLARQPHLAQIHRHDGGTELCLGISPCNGGKPLPRTGPTLPHAPEV